MWRFVMADVTHPLIGVNFISLFGLLVECRQKRPLDMVTSLSVPVQAASSLIPRVKTISGDTPIDSLLTEIQDLTRLAGVQREVSHNIIHYTWTIPGLAVTCRPQRMTPDLLAIVKAEFDAMVLGGTALRSKSSWSSTLYIMPKDNGWRPSSD
jgi:hypothetical protein